MQTVLTPLFAAATVLAFILTMVSADLGASETSVFNAIAGVSVLGASTVMTVLQERFS